MAAIETIIVLTTSDNGKTAVGSTMSKEAGFDRKPKTEPFVPLDVKPATTPAATTKNHLLVDAKPPGPVDVKPQVPIDVKPQLHADRKPPVPVDVKPLLPVVNPQIKSETEPIVHEEEEEGEEDCYEDDGLVSFSAFPVDIKPRIELLEDTKLSIVDAPSTKEEPMEEEGEEEYDDDDFVMAPRIRPVQDESNTVKRELAEPAEGECIGEEEEEYEAEEWIVQGTSVISRAILLMSASDEFLIEDQQLETLLKPFTRGDLSDCDLERPSFEVSDAQASIGSLSLDPEDPSIVIPRSINRFLRDYQRVGAAFLYRKYKQGHGGVLGDDMGLGKTIQVISFVSVGLGESH